MGSGKPAKQPLLALKPIDGRVASADDLGSVPVTRNEGRTANHRSEDRHRLSREDASARWGEHEQPVDLINLSGGGAMIEAAFRPMLWDRVDLTLGACGTLECAVRWIKGDRLGLEFAHETQIDASPEVRAQTLRAVIARSFPDVALAAPSEEPIVQPEVATAEIQSEDLSRRNGSRHPLIWTGEVHFNHDTVPVRLRNISAGGALVESPAGFPLGAELLLDLGEAGSLFSTVHWSHGDQVGLGFNQPFNVTFLSRSKPELAPSRWSTPDYLRGQPGDDSPWAAQWGRLNLKQLHHQLEGLLKR
jgi:PilZ domain